MLFFKNEIDPTFSCKAQGFPKADDKFNRCAIGWSSEVLLTQAHSSVVRWMAGVTTGVVNHQLLMLPSSKHVLKRHPRSWSWGFQGRERERERTVANAWTIFPSNSFSRTAYVLTSEQS